MEDNKPDKTFTYAQLIIPVLGTIIVALIANGLFRPDSQMKGFSKSASADTSKKTEVKKTEKHEQAKWVNTVVSNPYVSHDTMSKRIQKRIDELQQKSEEIVWTCMDILTDTINFKITSRILHQGEHYNLNLVAHNIKEFKIIISYTNNLNYSASTTLGSIHGNLLSGQDEYSIPPPDSNHWYFFTFKATSFQNETNPAGKFALILSKKLE
jgi:hypothetical protein